MITVPTEMSANDPPTLLGRRLIAFLDILGFSSRLETMPPGDLHAIYAGLIDHAKRFVFRQEDGPAGNLRSNFAKAQFLFDSIVLISNPVDDDTGPKNVFDFLSATALLFEKSFGRAMPLRGCIGYDDVFLDESRQIFLSPSFPALVREEKTQDWSGVTLLPTAVNPVLTALYGDAESEIARNGTGHVIQYATPRKSDGNSEAWCLNWAYLCNADDLRAGLTFLTGRKREETQRFADHVRELIGPGAPVAEAYRPVHRVLLQGARVGFHIKFVDQAGNGVSPPAGSTFNLVISVRAEMEKR
jgi:hypothetical protein